MTAETIKGRDVTIRFDASRYIHSHGCVLGHLEVSIMTGRAINFIT